jgi:hypothetical protein
MPLTKVELKPSVFKDNSDLDSEGAWTDAHNVRFSRGRPQAMGGTELLDPATFDGYARGAHAWVTLSKTKVFAWGTESKLMAYIGGAPVDITPPHSEGVLEGPFTTTAGSATVTVTHPNHRLRSGMTITFDHAVDVGGLALDGEHAVIAVTGLDTYTITAASTALYAEADGGGNVDYIVALPDGLITSLGGSGYGTSTYSTGFYGVSNTQEILTRVWSLDNWGENLVAVPRGYGLFEWQPELAYGELIYGGEFDASTGWALGTGWTVSGGAANKAAGTGANLSQSIAGIFEAGRTYRVTFDVVRTAGSIAFQVNCGDPLAVIDVGDASADIEVSGTYSRLFRCPVDPSDIVFAADSAFAGSIDNVSIKLESIAYRIDEAPFVIDEMFVDPAGLIVALGTEDETGVYNPTLVRWSDQENNRSWVPDTDNLAGSSPLYKGGRCVGGKASRNQNFVWTDEAVYQMTFTGSVDTVYRINLMGSGCGLIGANAAAEAGGRAFWITNGGQVFGCDGGAAQPIDCPLRRTDIDSILPLQGEKVFAAIYPQYNEVHWYYPHGDDDGECSRRIIFNWLENTWSCGTTTYTAGIQAGVFPNNIAFSTDNLIYYDDKGHTANGEPLSGFIESGYIDIEDGNNLMVLTRWIPDFDDQMGPVDLYITRKFSPNGEETEFGPFSAAPSTEMLNFRLVGRQLKFRLEFSSSPAFWRAGVLRFNVDKSGARR